MTHKSPANPNAIERTWPQRHHFSMRINRVMSDKPQTACSAAIFRRSKETATFLIEIVPHFSDFVKFSKTPLGLLLWLGCPYSLYASECSDVVTIFAVSRLFCRNLQSTVRFYEMGLVFEGISTASAWDFNFRLDEWPERSQSSID